MSKGLKMAVVGSRVFDDEELLRITLDGYYPYISHIITGGARGADELAAKYAHEEGIPLIIFKAQWNKFGKVAGFMRNALIVDAADEIVAFWDGTSPGTKHTTDLARQRKKACRVILFVPTVVES